MPRDLGRLTKKLGERPAWLDQIPAREMLEELGVENISDASMDELLFSCPFDGHAHGDERPSAYMNNGAKQTHMNTVWVCHGCGRSGNAIGFVSEYSGISRQRAKRELRERFAPGWHKPRGGSMRAELELRRAQRVAAEEDKYPEVPILGWEVYKRFEVDWSSYEDVEAPDVQYMFERGFTSSDLSTWRIGWDDDSDRITIPICTPDGELVGVKGRAWDPDTTMKYRVLGDTERTIRRNGVVYGFEPYLKSQVVFGLHMWGPQRTYVWDEGEINVMSWWKFAIPALSTGSASMSDAQAKIIREYADEVVVFVDNNKAGHSGTWGYTDKDGEYHPGAVARLSPHVNVRVAAVHDDDANDMLKAGQWWRARSLIHCAKPAWRLQASVDAL
jgi:DNA primase